jgi:hypothetical protein
MEWNSLRIVPDNNKMMFKYAHVQFNNNIVLEGYYYLNILYTLVLSLCPKNTHHQSSRAMCMFLLRNILY